MKVNKNHYDCNYQPLFLKIREYALLCLHKGYSIASTLGVTKKLTQQYVRSFRVLEKVGRPAYRLDVFPNWCIYPVFSMPQLEPAPSVSQDTFHRLHPDHPPSVFVEGDTDFSQSFKVEQLLNCRIIKLGRKTVTQYLVCWVEYGPEFDLWYSLNEFDNAADLMPEYEAILPK